MKVLSGAIVALAGAVVLSAAVLGTAVCRAADRDVDVGLGYFAGIVLFTVAALMLVRGWSGDTAS